MRINAGARANGLSYNQFIAGLKAADVELDRKVLADLAVADPAKFGELVEQAKSALARGEIDAAKRRSSTGRPSTATAARRSTRELCRRLADDPRVGALAPDLDWDLPLRLLGGAALPRARRRGVVGRHRRRARASTRRSCARFTRRAGGADERGAARVGAPAGVPLARRRPAVRPARARPVARG